MTEAAQAVDGQVGGEQVHLADRAQVETERVEARLDRQVDLRLLAGWAVGGRPLAVGTPFALAPSAATTSTPLLDQVRVKVAHLLLGDLDLLEARCDLLEGQIAALAALGDQRAQLLDLEERRFGRLRQKGYPFVFLSQPSLLSDACRTGAGPAALRLPAAIRLSRPRRAPRGAEP